MLIFVDRRFLLSVYTGAFCLDLKLRQSFNISRTVFSLIEYTPVRISPSPGMFLISHVRCSSQQEEYYFYRANRKFSCAEVMKRPDPFSSGGYPCCIQDG